jgi:hypothetical protein
MDVNNNLPTIRKISLVCPSVKCGYRWKYGGQGLTNPKIFLTSCPRCHSTVNIPKQAI